MAWRIDENVIRAEFDFRVNGEVRGRLWLDGMSRPVVIALDGVPEPDLRGQVLILEQREKTRPVADGFADKQRGSVGDMTASRKVKVPEVPVEEMFALAKCGKKFPWHWGNAVYLEWFSKNNGRVVIESVTMDARLNDPASVISVAAAEEDDDAPQSRREAEADAYSEYMHALTERVTLRLENEGNFVDYEAIFQEEREKLRGLYGMAQTDVDVSSDDEAVTEFEDDALRDLQESLSLDIFDEEDGDDESWIEDDGENVWEESDEMDEDENHPLVIACLRRSELIVRAIEDNQWLPDTQQEDHPLEMLHHAVMFAGVKLSGALMEAQEQWPPNVDEAAHILVNLKAARRQFRDAMLALESCREELLANDAWLTEVEAAVKLMVAEVNDLILDARLAIANAESSDEA